MGSKPASPFNLLIPGWWPLRKGGNEPLLWTGAAVTGHSAARGHPFRPVPRPKPNTTHPSGWKRPCHNSAKKTEIWKHSEERSPVCSPDPPQCVVCICHIRVLLQFPKTRAPSYWRASPFSHTAGLVPSRSPSLWYVIFPLPAGLLRVYVQSHKALSFKTPNQNLPLTSLPLVSSLPFLQFSGESLEATAYPCCVSLFISH